MTDVLEVGRRVSDPGRVDRLELSVGQLRDGARDLAHALEVVKLEQLHSKELFEARFRVQDTQASETSHKLNTILGKVEEILTNPETTTAGRATTSAIQIMSTELATIKAWRLQTEGMVALVKYVGWSFVLFVIGVAAVKLVEIVRGLTGP